MRKNVLASRFEPTDKELNELMKEVIRDVKWKAQLAKEKFEKNLAEGFKKLK
jgi:hypothetical protein